MFLGINEMRSASSLVALGVALALSAGQAVAATPQEGDSVYQYGRWAVLSPAAGAGQPYVAAVTPDAANNLRPEEGFSPVVLGSEPVVEPPGVVPNPPGNPPPSGDPRGPQPPEVVLNPGPQPPVGDPRTPPVVVQQPPTVVAN